MGFPSIENFVWGGEAKGIQLLAFSLLKIWRESRSFREGKKKNRNQEPFPLNPPSFEKITKVTNRQAQGEIAAP